MNKKPKQIYKAILGIDVSKATLDSAIILLTESETFLCSIFDNNIKGFKALLKWGQKQSGGKNNELLICMEHTGGYSQPLAQFCYSQGVDCCLETPIQIKRSIGLTRGKTDQVDAIRIAEYANRFYDKLKLYRPPTEVIKQLNDWMAHRERLVNMQHRMKCGIENVVNKNVLSETKKMLTFIARQIKTCDSELERLINQDNELQELHEQISSVKGIGLQTSVALIVYTQGFTRMLDTKQLACYSGIAPFPHQSGTSIHGKNRVNHFANKRIKTLLNLSALTAVKFDAELKTYYERKVDEGKNKMLVLNNVRNKLIARIVSCVKNKKKWVPIDKLNLVA